MTKKDIFCVFKKKTAEPPKEKSRRIEYKRADNLMMEQGIHNDKQEREDREKMMNIRGKGKSG